ncbi:TonB-dependent siderophore receptor [Xylophilus sp. GOD-11R]|nr:TonB-dependent siderophore receptor [Xylophilus sp. GOD-11R]WPB59495.1 TonB-dependent siderophore receptor [Xylophilus sp. GOD-11R]
MAHEELTAVEVVGQRESSGYHAEEVAGAKTELRAHELPQSVRVLPRQALDDLAATRLDEVLDYASGVSRQNTVGGLTDAIAIRGLPGNEDTGLATLLNGFSANRGYNAPRDLAGVERIEFLKGPAAALYGSSEPGGTINVVSKRPLWRTARSAEVSVGDLGLRRAAVDLSGPISENFAYRLNVAAEKRDGFRDFVGSERQVVAPAFTWKLSRSTVLEYVGEYLNHQAPLDRGVVAVNNRLGAIPASRFLGEPADGDATARNLSHQFALSHDFNADWRGRLAVSQREATIKGFSTEATALRADGFLTRQRRYRDYGSDDAAVQAELHGRLMAGGLEHELLVGVEAYRFKLNTFLLRANPTAAAPYAIDIYNPVYGQAQPVPPLNTDTREVQRNTALYLQDAIRLSEQWRLVAGVRLDAYDQSLENRRTGHQTGQEPNATSPRLGLSWLPTPQWTVYANAGRSFRPNAGSDAAANGFDPETGRSLELGAKWESADKRLGASAALFDIRKRNVLTADPANAGFSAAAGKVRSRGLEFDLSGRLSLHWRVSAALALNDVEITEDNTLEVGGRLLNAPRVNGSVLALYEDVLSNGQRFGVGGGVVHVGKRLGAPRTQAEAAAGTLAFELPDYTTAKLLAWWRVTPTMRVSLNVDNLFDSTYYASSYNRVWVAPGSTRAVTVGLQAMF